jgi:hypothetical protein
MTRESVSSPMDSDGTLIQIDHLTKVYQLGEVDVHALLIDEEGVVAG